MSWGPTKIGLNESPWSVCLVARAVVVVAATPATMANAVKAGLLETDADPRGAERRGKEFEVEVRQALPAR